jgi:uncharacterized integral membrane protein (TIGR00697 family)
MNDKLLLANLNKQKQLLKYYPLLAILIITAQLAANVLGPRTIQIGQLILPGGIWSFPLTFCLWDIVTEIYGFKSARQLIFYYFIGQLFFAFLIIFGLSMPAVPHLPEATLYSVVLGNIGKLTVSMVIAVTVGDYINCFVLEKIKIMMNGRHLWIRLFGATALGEFSTSCVWVILFYFHKSVHPDIIKLIASQYVVKMLYEIVAIIPTYIIIAYLKKHEGMDSHRRYINFDPITLKPFVVQPIEEQD